MRSACLAVILAIVAPSTANAQDTVKKIIAAFSSPVHPIVESVGPGGGFGAGLAFRPKLRANERWSFRAEALITPKRYWNLEGVFSYTTDRVHAEAYGRARELARLDFYGLGQGASLDARSSFRYNERTMGGLVSVPFRVSRVGLRIGSRLEGLFPDVGSGRNPDTPSLEEAFTDSEAAGLLAQPNFLALTGFFIAQFPDDLNQLSRVGVDAVASYTSFQAEADHAFDFNRFTFEAQQRLPGLRDSDKLTLHQLYSSDQAASGSRVPFYLQQTLGGAGQVRSMHDQLLGSDATKATLRGFRDLRFRGPHLVLLQAEYRLKLVGPVDATIFADTGMVAEQRVDLKLPEFARNYGFSLSVMTIDATAFRVDVGFGGKEGTHVFFSVGPIFQQ